MKDMNKLFPYIKPYWMSALAALVFLISIVIMDLAIPRLIQRIIDQGITLHNMNVVLQTSLWMLGITVLSTLFTLANNSLSIRVGEGVARDLRQALFLKIQAFSFGNIDRYPTGKLMVRLTSDTSAVQRLIQVSLRIGTRAPLLLIGSILLMVKTSDRLALSILPLLLVAFALIVVFIIFMEPLFRSVQQKLDGLNTMLQENIAGIRLVKAFVREDFEKRRFEVTNQEYTERTVRVMQFMASMSPALTVLVNIAMVLVIWIGGGEAIRGELTNGQIVAFTNYLITSMTPLIMMTLLSNTWANGIASWLRINEVLTIQPEVQDAADARLLGEKINGDIDFKQVVFRYNTNSQATVLDGLSFNVAGGTTLAILGTTGAGKSSLIDLIPRFYDVNQGKITIDGIDVRDIRQDSLLSKIGVVPQETVLFSGSVRENIAYGHPEASMDEIMSAAKVAQAHDFIQDMPQGYETRIEERGVNLSGGQKQRIAIARAILMHPSILILDDSTSAVDYDTETKIQQAIDESIHWVTKFIVAQRISSVINADTIIVLDKGKINAQGTHAELLKTNPVYQEIYSSQMGNGFIPE